MVDPKFAQKIISELPSLVSQNVIDTNAADSLRCHYEPHIKPSRSISIGLTVSAILGGLLVGAGIILLIAHNWDELSKPMRAIFAMLPLVISAGFSCYTMLRRMDSAAWREGCGMFYFLSIGASIALVSQTYHLYNDLGRFLFVWALLSLPLIYLLKSGAIFIGYLACITTYTLEVNGYRNNSGSWMPALLLLVIMPFYAWHIRKQRDSLTVMWLSYALAIALAIMTTTLCHGMDFINALACYGLIFVIYYLISCWWFGGLRGFRGPFRSIGCLGLAVTSMILTFGSAYRGFFWSRNHAELEAIMTFFIAAGIIWAAFAGFMLWRKTYFNWAAALFPVFLILAFALGESPDGIAPLIMSAYVLALGAFTLVRGVQRDSLLSINEGMVLVTALIVCRFFDSDYGFVARGVAFILMGCGFLVVNLLVLKKRRDGGTKGARA